MKVPGYQASDLTLGEMLEELLESVNLMALPAGDVVLIGRPGQFEAARKVARMAWPDLTEHRITETIEDEHIATVLERWGRDAGIYFHLDPYWVAPADTTPDTAGPPTKYQTDGMVKSLTLNETPLPKALELLLAPLKLSYWYGQPGPDQNGFPIHPSVWISAPPTLDQIARGTVTQFTFHVALYKLDDTAYQDGYLKLQKEKFGNRSTLYRSAIVTNLIELEPSQSMLDAFEKAIGGKLTSSADIEMLTAPRVTTSAGNAWWPGSAGSVSMLAMVENPTFPASQTLKLRTRPSGGCLFGKTATLPADWNPFDSSGRFCGPRTTLEIPADIPLREVDDLLPGAADFLAKYEHPAVIVDYTEVFDPPLDPPAQPSRIRAGRRNDTVPRRRFKPFPDGTTEVTHYHEGFLVGLQGMTQDNDSNITVCLVSQYRPTGAGLVPWKGTMTKFALREGDIAVLEYPSFEEGEHLLLLVQVQARNSTMSTPLRGEEARYKVVASSRSRHAPDSSPFGGRGFGAGSPSPSGTFAR